MANTPPMVAVANLKGGVGKSTTALMLAEALAYHYHLNVLLFDFDAQANLSEMLLTSEGVQRQLNQHRGVPALLDQFLPGAERRHVALSDVVETRTAAAIEELVLARQLRRQGGWVSILPAHPGMRFLEPHLERSPGQGWFEIGDQIADLVLESTEEVRGQCDLVLIDCPPHVSALCRTALKLADYYVTPTLAEPLSIWGVQQFLRWLAHPHMSAWVGKARDSLVDRQFVVCTRYSPRSRSHRRTLEKLQTDWAGRAFAAPIRQRLAIGEDLTREAPDSLHPFASRYRGEVKTDATRLARRFAEFMADRAGIDWASRVAA